MRTFSIVDNQDIINELSVLLDGTEFSTRRGILLRGEHLEVSIDTKASESPKNTAPFDLIINCRLRPQQRADWQGVPLFISQHASDTNIEKFNGELISLSQFGLYTKKNCTPGNYQIMAFSSWLQLNQEKTQELINNKSLSSSIRTNQGDIAPVELILHENTNTISIKSDHPELQSKSYTVIVNEENTILPLTHVRVTNFSDDAKEINQSPNNQEIIPITNKTTSILLGISPSYNKVHAEMQKFRSKQSVKPKFLS